MPATLCPCRKLDNCQREAGFTLIELMVSMAIGLILAAALLTMYVNTTRTNLEMAKTNGQIENGRFATRR